MIECDVAHDASSKVTMATRVKTLGEHVCKLVCRPNLNHVDHSPLRVLARRGALPKRF